MTYPRSCAHTWSNMGPKVSIQQNEAEYLEYLDSENLGVRYVLHAKGPLTTFGNGTEWDVLSHTTNGLALWTPVIFLSWNFMTKPEGANCRFAEICTHYKSTLRCAVCECVPYTGGRHDKKHQPLTLSHGLKELRFLPTAAISPPTSSGECTCVSTAARAETAGHWPQTFCP